MSSNSTWNSTTMLFYSTMNVLPEIWKYTFGSLMCLLSVISTTENVFVASLLYKFSVLRNPSNVILMSLALSGGILGLIAAPLHAVQLLNDGVVNIYVVDVARQYASTVFIGVYALTLGFISFDRCLHMIKLRNYKMSYAVVYGTLLPCWIIPMLIPFLRQIISDCEKAHFVVIITFGTMILVTINSSYVGLLYSLRKITCMSHKEESTDRLYIQNEKHAGSTVFIAVTTYTALIIPIFTYYALCSMDAYDQVTLSKSYVIGAFSALSSTVVTPLVYIIRTPPLRKYVRELFYCPTLRKHSTGYSDDTFSINGTFI